MTASEVGHLLGISARAVYALAAPAGPVPCVRIGRRLERRFCPKLGNFFPTTFRGVEQMV